MYEGGKCEHIFLILLLYKFICNSCKFLQRQGFCPSVPINTDTQKHPPKFFFCFPHIPGSQSIQLGLADGLRTVGSVARDVIMAEKIVDFTIKDNLAERFAKRFRAGGTPGAAALLGIDRPLFR